MIHLINADNIIIDEIWAYNSYDTGIGVSFADNVSIINNRLTDSQTAHGLSIYNSSTNIRVVNNYCYNNTQHGISLSSVNGALINSNQCNNNTASGIYLVTADNNIISGNECNSNAYGINISNAGCDRNVVTGNRATGNGTANFNDQGTNTLFETAAHDAYNDFN